MKKIKIWPFSAFSSRFLTCVDLFYLESDLFWKALAKSFILRYNLSTFEKDWNLTFFAIFDRLRPFFRNFWPLLTFFDFKINFFEKPASSASFWGIVCLLSKKIEIWPSFAIFDLFRPFFRDFWPVMTFFDSETNFYEKLSPRASFWGIICLLLEKMKIWPFSAFSSRFLTFVDLFWTRDWLFWKALAKSFILRYNLSSFWEISKFAQKWPKFGRKW